MFSDQLLDLGRIHWYLVKATKLVEARSIEPNPSGSIHRPTLTPLGREVENDEINWWVFKREHDIPSFDLKTKDALQAAQTVKEAAAKFIKSRYPSLEKLSEAYELFARQYHEEISTILKYIQWLHQRDELAPTILFNYRTWGTTRRAERIIDVPVNDLYDIQEVRKLTSIVLGLSIRGTDTVEMVKREMEYELYESIDPEDYDGEELQISTRQLEMNSASKAASQFYEYFEHLRDSLRNILLDIEKRNNEETLFTSDDFWQLFIPKASQSNKTEQTYWDFKETLEMWRTKDVKAKRVEEHKFAERIAGFANNLGGVIIVGVTDTVPRKIIGLGTNMHEIEDYMKYTRKVIKTYLKYDAEFVHLQQVSVVDQHENKQLCLVIVIRQTYLPVSVKGLDGRSYSAPFRAETGLIWEDPGALSIKKMIVKSDNYNFLNVLRQFVYQTS